jgi:hypothetical protein
LTAYFNKKIMSSSSIAQTDGKSISRNFYANEVCNRLAGYSPQ